MAEIRFEPRQSGSRAQVLTLLNSSPRRQGLDSVRMTPGPGTGQNKEEVSRNSVPGSLGLAQGGFLLSKVLQVQGSQLTMCIPASLWLTLPQGLSTNPPACSAASSQGSPIIFPDFLRVSPSSAFLEGLPLCCRSYLPVCFLLAKPLVLIHLHKHRGPPRP